MIPVLKRLMSIKSTMSSKYIWCDLEMTGLKVETDVIMEVACIITRPDLEPVHEGIDMILHVPDDKLSSMDEWCTRTHGNSGLTASCRTSKIYLEDAEKQLVDYIAKHTDPSDNLYMAGNSVGYDRMFVNKYMPKVTQRLHYRLLDVTSIKILVQDWYPKDFEPRKKLEHRALDDIRESIDELKHYRNNIFKNVPIQPLDWKKRPRLGSDGPV